MTRIPVVAGLFYPANPVALASEIDGFLTFGKKRTEQSQKTALLAMCPHAGYVYCGAVIGATLSGLEIPNRIILLGPNHTGKGAPLAVWPDGAWQTPLGEVPVDTDTVELLLASGGGFTADTLAHQQEHSLEVLLPFVQRLARTPLITPISVSCPPDDLEKAGKALASVVSALNERGERVMFLVSSDMNHYANKEDTLRLDKLALDAFSTLDPVQLFNTVASNRISMCGVYPATLGLFACRELGATQATLVGHTTSADASGDTSHVVGYAGMLVS